MVEFGIGKYFFEWPQRGQRWVLRAVVQKPERTRLLQHEGAADQQPP
jgi:hypothetical protein